MTDGDFPDGDRDGRTLGADCGRLGLIRSGDDVKDVKERERGLLEEELRATGESASKRGFKRQPVDARRDSLPGAETGREGPVIEPHVLAAVVVWLWLLRG